MGHVDKGDLANDVRRRNGLVAADMGKTYRRGNSFDDRIVIWKSTANMFVCGLKGIRIKTYQCTGDNLDKIDLVKCNIFIIWINNTEITMGHLGKSLIDSMTT
ncbi:hypothetical protein CEXT_479171 [Caerostris extrusa]|uniref:Uncharacterized protein n=1 Tax=Caerostris extrusa TaxID=172846 RepID=A0AAV4R467_CAEEX|nr:hypothetical protein CEXT_479171 [Caerostris extrusa]